MLKVKAVCTIAIKYSNAANPLLTSKRALLEKEFVLLRFLKVQSSIFPFCVQVNLAIRLRSAQELHRGHRLQCKAFGKAILELFCPKLSSPASKHFGRALPRHFAAQVSGYIRSYPDIGKFFSFRIRITDDNGLTSPEAGPRPPGQEGQFGQEGFEEAAEADKGESPSFRYDIFYKT